MDKVGVRMCNQTTTEYFGRVQRCRPMDARFLLNTFRDKKSETQMLKKKKMQKIHLLGRFQSVLPH